jgi:hypothetical protein
MPIIKMQLKELEDEQIGKFLVFYIKLTAKLYIIQI